MNWYKFHLGDYITQTAHLSDAEDLCYRRLLDLYYMTEKPLQANIEWLAKRTRLDSDIVEFVVNEYFDLLEDGYHNRRCDEEITKYQAQVVTNKELAKRPRNRADAGEKQKSPTKKKPNSESNSEALTDGSPNQEPRTISISSFDDFWAAWPTSKRKVGKSTCEAKWNKHNLKAIAPRIIAHVNASKQTEQWTSGYDPAPLTYLNQKRWEDEVADAFAGRKAI
jgi:hypothetical protein